MCGKLNLSHLSAAECEQILQVVQRDSVLDHIEKQRLSQIKAEVEEEEVKSEVLAKYQIFNEKSCIRCFSRFFFFFNKKLVCAACRFYVCKKCCELDNGRIKNTLCKACYKERLLTSQSNEWFYSAVSRKFKHSGTAKVIRNLFGRRCFGNTVDVNASPAYNEASASVYDSVLPFADIRVSRSRTDVMREMSDKSLLQNSPLEGDIREGNYGHTTGTSDDMDGDASADHSAVLRSEWMTALGCSADVESAERLVSSLDRRDQTEKETSLVSLSGNILRLVEGVSKTQGQVTTTASRMMRSADTMSSLYEELDQLDRKLDGLEAEVDDVIDISNDDVMAQCIYDDYHARETSAEALGMVTSAALQLLCAPGDADRYVSTDGYRLASRVRNVERDEIPSPVDSLTSEGQVEDQSWVDGEVSPPIYSPDVPPVLSPNNDGRRIEAAREWGDHPFQGSGRKLNGQSTTVERPGSYGASVQIYQGGSARNHKRGVSGVVDVTNQQRLDSIKRTEQKIYLTSGKVFSLEDRLSELEQQVLMVDSSTCSEEEMARLENEIARAVAQVTLSDHEVGLIEENLFRQQH